VWLDNAKTSCTRGLLMQCYDLWERGCSGSVLNRNEFVENGLGWSCETRGAAGQENCDRREVAEVHFFWPTYTILLSKKHVVSTPQF
jgi:hypothetical protein